ncbi:hypothetical protein Bpro_3365 [Polaromonas sp. JS666]|nr:hypothetical protein Bpro_3365 [Polaromonas sp. JS666]
MWALALFVLNLKRFHPAAFIFVFYPFTQETDLSMEILPLVLLLTVASFLLKKSEQRKRIVLLASHLGNYQIEKLMETLAEGYLRALGESDLERREQIWRYLDTTETQLCLQFNKFCAEFAKLDAADTRVSTLALPFPYAAKLFPQATFDLRKVLAIHAHGLMQATSNALNRTPRDKAFTLSAELFLMQHTCHWFCNSKAVASARLMARHKTTHAQVLGAVGPDTRAAYAALTGS